MPREKKGVRKRSISRTEWAAFAVELRRDLSSVRYGERLSRYRDLAAKHGLDANVIRRTLRALAALEEIAQADADLADRLRCEPLAVAETVARWLKHHPVGALAAGRDYLAGRLTTVSLTESEKAARSERIPEKLTVSEWRHAVQDCAHSLLGPDYRIQHEDMSIKPPEQPLWSTVYYNSKRMMEKVSVFGPGPWSDKKNYQKQMAFVVFSAAASIQQSGVEHAVIVLPNRRIVDHYEAFWRESPVSSVPLKFISV